MFFVLSKTAALLLVPSNLLLLVGLAGLLLLSKGRRRFGRILAGTSLVLFLVIGLLPVGGLLNFVLENRFPVWDASRGPPDGIIVLGGAIDPLTSQVRGQTVLGDAAERITIIAKLARDYPNARIVFTSGDASLLADMPKEADALYPLLDTFGVPRARVALERNSRNTAENAAFTKAMVAPKPGERWLLVTSAQHMPRAIGCFRKIGFPVEAYPVDWHTLPRWRWRSMLTAQFGQSLAATDMAAHEWLGLFVYWLTGRTSEFLPGP
ncbi:MAG: YdcF family protein [Pseudolabrys sp.]